MQKQHLIIAALAFIICLISAYFGVRIYNANENFLLTDLNEFDKIYHDDVKLVPVLSFKAAIITFPFVLAILVLEIIISIRSKIKQVKNIGRGLMIAALIVMTIDILTLVNPQGFDFSKWGFVWICFGLFFIAGNMLSYFITRFGKSSQSH